MRIFDELTIETKQAIHAWIFLAVPILFFVVIRFYPAIEAFGIAFTEWNLLSPARFVGLENFRRLLEDPEGPSCSYDPSTDTSSGRRTRCYSFCG